MPMMAIGAPSPGMFFSGGLRLVLWPLPLPLPLDVANSVGMSPNAELPESMAILLGDGRDKAVAVGD